MTTRTVTCFGDTFGFQLLGGGTTQGNLEFKLGCFCQEFDFNVHHVFSSKKCLKRSHLEKINLAGLLGEMRGPFMNLKHTGTLPETNIAPEK